MDTPCPQTMSSGGLLPQPGRSSWGRWWLRASLWIAHLGLLVSAVILTPEGYHEKLGYYTGTVLLLGTVLLWALLYSARTKGLVALFCGLTLAQAGFAALFVFQFRAEDRVLKGIMVEAVQHQKEAETEIASFRLGRLFEMLTSGNEFHPEELPGLLERARTASSRVREIQVKEKEWIVRAENGLAAVSKQAAANFRRGVESSRPNAERASALTKDYFAAIESLAEFLIGRQRQYRFTDSGPVFTREQDAERYNQMLARLETMEEQLNSFREKQQELLKTAPDAGVR